MRIPRQGITPRERRVLELYFGLGGHRIHTLAQIGQTEGVSRQRIHQLMRQAHTKVRELLSVPKHRKLADVARTTGIDEQILTAAEACYHAWKKERLRRATARGKVKSAKPAPRRRVRNARTRA